MGNAAAVAAGLADVVDGGFVGAVVVAVTEAGAGVVVGVLVRFRFFAR